MSKSRIPARSMATARYVNVVGLTRGAFLVRGALAAAAVYGADAASGFVAHAFAQSSSGDLDVLNFLLGIENVQVALYSTALSKANLSGGQHQLATELSSQEQQHAAALSQAITQSGGSPAAAPKASFTFTDAAGFVGAAQSVEDTVVSAYNGAIVNLQSPDLILAAASIAQADARHAAAIRLQHSQPPAPSAFDAAASQQQAQAALRSVK
jgi:hypothetical protein